MLPLTRQRDISTWYRPDTSRNGADVAREAYIAAVQYFEKELAHDDKKREWVRSHATMDEAVEVVTKAMQTYTQTSGKESQTLKCLNAFAARVTYYGDVLDVMAQHHPEYVALAWGAIKFLLVGVLNHAESVAKLASGLCEIGDLMRLVQHEINIYPTDHMLDAVSRLYAHVMHFLLLAARWYKKPRHVRALSSIFNPFELRCQPVLDSIRSSFQNVSNIANGASRAETRDLTISVQEVQKLLGEVHAWVNGTYTLLQDVHGQTTRTLDITTATGERLCRMEHADVIAYLEPSRLPEDTLFACKSIARRRALWQQPSSDFNAFVHTLNRWISGSDSSLFTVRTGFRAEARTKDLAVEVAAMLKETNQPILWYLSERSAKQNRSVDLSDVLKTLIFQLLRQDTELSRVEPDMLNVAKFRGSHTEQEWLDLLLALLRRVSACFVVVETEAIYETTGKDGGWSHRLLDAFTWIVSNTKGAGNVVKVLLVTYADCVPKNPSAAPNPQSGADRTLTLSTFVRQVTAAPVSKKQRLAAVAVAGRRGRLARLAQKSSRSSM